MLRRTSLLTALTMLAALASLGCQGPQYAASGPTADLRRRSLDLLLRAAESQYDDVAANAIEAMVHVAPQQGGLSFRNALKSNRPLVRFAGLVALGDLRDARPAREYQRLLNDSEPLVRIAAAYALLRAGGDDAVYGPVLAGALSDSADERVRAEAAHLIGKLGKSAAIPRLRLAAKRDSSSIVMTHSIAAMAQLGDEAAFNDLVAMTQGDSVARVIALQTLIDLADTRAEEALRSRLYIHEREHEFVVLRLMAARGLGEIGVRDGYRAAAYAAENADVIVKRINDEAARFEESLSIKVNAALALGAIRDRRALGLLEAMARDEDPPVQVAACYAILRILGQ